MALDLLLVEDNTWEAGPAAAPEIYSDRKAYRKVLKHRQLQVSQIRAVSRSAVGGSLGKEMGKLLVKRAQVSGARLKRSPAIFTHLICMHQSVSCDEKPCRTSCRDRVPLK